jgi:hypothetical protein
MSPREHHIDPSSGHRSSQWQDMAEVMAGVRADREAEARSAETPAPPPQAEQESSLGVMTYVLVLRIEAYRETHAQPPPNLETLGLPLTGFDYTPRGQEYELTATAGATRVSYRSGDPPSILLERNTPTAGAAPTTAPQTP